MNAYLSNRIMIVDDDEENRLAVLETCRDLGISAVLTDDGVWALTQLEEEHCNWLVVISSWKMPKMNGSVFLSRAVSLSASVQNWVLTTAISPEYSRDLNGFLKEFPEIKYWKKPAVISDFIRMLTVNHSRRSEFKERNV